MRGRLRDRLENAAERLDEPGHDPAELAGSLDQVAAVNRWLGGTRAVLRELDALAPPGAPTAVLDIGTGSADIPLAVVRHARRTGRDVAILATDVHPQVVAIAAARTACEPAIRVGTADARALPFPDEAFDVALLSLTLHHFDGDEQRRVLREAARVARRAVIVNELERNTPNWIGARLLALTLWRGNRITRHDGPISVLRAFRPDELLAAARDAGLDVVALRRRFFYRLVMVARRTDSRAARTV